LKNKTEAFILCKLNCLTEDKIYEKYLSFAMWASYG